MKGGGVLPHESYSDEVKLCIEDRLQDRDQIMERFREIEIQLRGCRELANKTKESIMRGDQYVNYSHITLKAGGQHITAGGTLTDIDGVDMESYVNQRVLSTRPCGECKYCIDPKSNVLCIERQRNRSEIIAEFDQKIREMAKNGTGKTKKNGEKSKELKWLPILFQLHLFTFL
jgi:hypothetical protein